MDTKKLRQKILDLAIRGKLVPQDPNDEPASVLLERIKAEKERLIKEGKIKRSKKTTKTSDTPHYENVPFEVPKGWCWCRLEEIAYVTSGSTPNKESFASEGIPYLKMYNLRNQKIDFDFKPQYIKAEVHNGKLKRSRTEVGDLIMNIVGPPLGKLAIIPSSLPQANFNQAAVLIRPLLYKTVLTKYLFYYLSEMSEINSISTKGSAGQINISLTQSQNIRVPLPPLSEQNRIITEIEYYFVLINNIEQSQIDLQTAIKQTKSKILNLAIHGKLVPQDPSDEPASELLKRINPKAEITCDNAHYTQLPKGWSVAPMQILCSLIDGNKQNGIERINLDVKYLRGERDYKTLTSGKYISAKSFLILVDDENSGEVFKTPIEGYQGSTFKQLSINENMNSEYLLQVINFYRKLLRENKVGSAIPHLNKKLFKEIKVSIPPYREQQRIVDAINKAFMSLDTIMENL
ncbi:restriction endonuclease subunit S [Phocaeicola plebeius]|uniref:Restriction endonuclease subunit S n=1 Tax=Phocaeicola plebeius TaxID=310297 RepID=A0A412H3N6_9BACT|nr:restriction endonuclease subunit S [Phocaeicola plebeius]RGS04725.1 restriction endonuclease subunit S [Phocaeicola plebeius]